MQCLYKLSNLNLKSGQIINNLFNKNKLLLITSFSSLSILLFIANFMKKLRNISLH